MNSIGENVIGLERGFVVEALAKVSQRVAGESPGILTCVSSL